MVTDTPRGVVRYKRLDGFSFNVRPEELPKFLERNPGAVPVDRIAPPDDPGTGLLQAGEIKAMRDEIEELREQLAAARNDDTGAGTVDEAVSAIKAAESADDVRALLAAEEGRPRGARVGVTRAGEARLAELEPGV